MSTHWRLAAGGAALAASISLVVTLIVGMYAGWANAGAFLYGAGVGVASFTTIAVTATLLSGKLTGGKVLLGMAVYVGRLLFAVVAVGVPLYLGSWPALPMICGFAGVYVIENVLLLLGAARARGALGRAASGVEERNGG